MTNYNQNEEIPTGKDPQIWKLAQDRVGFKRHAVSYLIINLMLWAIWLLTSNNINSDRFPWPIWTTVFWGVGLAFHFASTYIFHKSNNVEREYEKLMKKKK